MTDAKQSVKQGIVRKLHIRDQLVGVADSATQQLSQPDEDQQLQQQKLLCSAPGDSRQCNVCDWLSLGLTCLTCLLFGAGFYLWLFHGLFPDGEVTSRTARAATAGVYTLCGATGVLLLHILLCFGRVVATSAPSRQELRLFTEFSRQCKMLTGVRDVEEVELALDGNFGDEPESVLVAQVSRGQTAQV